MDEYQALGDEINRILVSDQSPPRELILTITAFQDQSYRHSRRQSLLLRFHKQFKDPATDHTKMFSSMSLLILQAIIDSNESGMDGSFSASPGGSILYYSTTELMSNFCCPVPLGRGI
jgi:hypothetical protein